MLGLDAQHGLPAKLLVEWLQYRGRAEHEVGGVLHLREASVVGLPKHIEHRTALLGVAVENVMQTIGGEVVRQLVGARKVVDVRKGVVRQGEVDACRGELAGQSGMAVAIELQPERTPGRDPQAGASAETIRRPRDRSKVAAVGAQHSDLSLTGSTVAVLSCLPLGE
jgi:hypothetical protein